ncbi:MAG TPA: DeoR family transcriptional regulator [Acidothermaceae bacterium]
MIPAVALTAGETPQELPLAPARQRTLLDELSLRGGLTLAEAIRLTGASGTTVRRDFDALARRGLATRVHGGIVGPWLLGVDREAHVLADPAARAPSSPW